MEIAITKGQNEDFIVVVRGDGTRAETRFPHKGPVPHDAVHLFVERGFRFRTGFWGQIARGNHPEEIAAMAKAGGHASAKRARVPDDEIVEMIQAERLVECFEADLWGGGASDADLLSVAEAGCAASKVPMPTLDAAAISRIRGEIARFAADWQAAAVGHVARLEWPDIAP
jgi:hypothetical protein